MWWRTFRRCWPRSRVRGLDSATAALVAGAPPAQRPLAARHAVADDGGLGLVELAAQRGVRRRDDLVATLGQRRDVLAHPAARRVRKLAQQRLEADAQLQRRLAPAVLLEVE